MNLAVHEPGGQILSTAHTFRRLTTIEGRLPPTSAQTTSHVISRRRHLPLYFTFPKTRCFLSQLSLGHGETTRL